MEILIKDKTENATLSRQEVTCELHFEKAVPSRKEIREALAASLGTDAALIVVVKVKGSFGSKTAVAQARAYKDKNALAVERKYVLVRNSLAEKEAKKAAAKAPAKK